jgi:hypothetical protein
MPRNPSPLTIEQKLASGGFLDFRREFCPWVGMCAVTGYKQIKEGRLRLTKIGRKSVVAAQDAIAYREELRAASGSAKAA